MRPAIITFIFCVCAAADDSYLVRMKNALALGREAAPTMAAAADEAAAKIVAGGRFHIAGHPGVVSELIGRAGGLMLLKPLGDQELKTDDVILFAATQGHELPASVSSSGALVLLLSDAETAGETIRWFDTHAADCGLSESLAAAAPGWLLTGEIIGALTRLGKMPVIYESIGMYGGFGRIQTYDAKGVFWHEDHTVEPIPAGQMSTAFADTLTRMLDRAANEDSDKLAEVGRRAAEARAAGKRTIMYSMGHLFPGEVADTAIGTVFESAVWNSGFSAFPVPEDTYQAGDVVIHIGYQHPPYRLLPKIAQAGAFLAYVDLYEHRDYRSNPNILWIDPMWDWTDACVPIPGYDIPALAASGLVNGALAWQIYRQYELHSGTVEPSQVQ